MKSFKTLLAFLFIALAMPWQVRGLQDAENVAAIVSGAVYSDLVLYAKYCAASYGSVCPRPMGNTLVERIRVNSTGTDGMVVRDDRRREIIVVFRGTSEIMDALTDILLVLSPLESPGLTDVDGAKVHTGFLHAYNSAAPKVLRIVQGQLQANPSYKIVVTGHSLGGAIASLGAISIRAAFPRASLRLFTFGQPRTGDHKFADYVERSIGVDHIYRAVHTFDGVPTIPPKFLGYEHFVTEYWNFLDPPSALTTRQCQGRENPLCSGSIPSTGINLAHTVYFGQVMLGTPSVCS